MTYSIIIPHKNAPDLLQRCIASIPPRDDVQIIVVDDNSDRNVVDWEKFSFDRKKNIELVITTEGRWAGHARNVGLNHAKGQWILFADCDDYYCEGFLDVLDKYTNQNWDVVYYSHFNVDSYGRKKENVLINKALTSSNSEFVDAVKFRQRVPWNKMVRKSFIDSHNIHFEECINGNDLFFSYQVGYYSNLIVLEPTPLYCYVHNKGSLTHRKKNPNLFYSCIIGHRLKSNRFYRYIGYSQWEKPMYRVFMSFLFKRGVSSFLQAIIVYVRDYKRLHNCKNEFVEYFKGTNKGVSLL